MIANKQTEISILEKGNQEDVIEMSLDQDSSQILMNMLSKNLYSDPIGSLIRETCSNALDSHRRINQTAPIVVSLGVNENNSYEFSVEDIGSGLDEDDVKNIISKYGKSTKRMSVNELGMFGLGYKSPLAYTSSFYFICRKDGIERKYIMYEKEEINSIDLLHATSTIEQNGVKIIVPINHNDVSTFLKKIKEQLCYFENVYFNIPNFNNDFKIAKHELFQVSDLCEDYNLHICLDNVYYPIDFSKLGIYPIHMPLGLKFSLLDNIFPTPSRENIIYSKNTKEIIIDKIKKVADYFVNEYNTIIENNQTFEFFIKNLDSSDPKIIINKHKINVINIQEYSCIKKLEPKIKGLILSDAKKTYNAAKYYFLDYYDQKYKIQNYICTTKFYSNLSLNDLIENCKKAYFFTEKLSFHKKEYLKTISSKPLFVFYKRKEKRKLFGINGYKKILLLENFPKSEWRDRIKDYQLIERYITDKIIDIDSVEIPKEFFEKRKLQKNNYITKEKYIKKEKEINVFVAKPLVNRFQDKNCKFEKQIIDLEKINVQKGLMVYTSYNDKKLLDNIFDIVNKQKIFLFAFSEKELKTINNSNIHNLVSLENCMATLTKPFKRIVTAYLIYNLTKKYDSVFNNLSHIKILSDSLYEELKELNDYLSSNLTHYLSSFEKKLLDVMVETATTNNSFDLSIYHKIQKNSELLEKLNFLNILSKKLNFNNEEELNIIIDLCKYHKIKLNINNYKPIKTTKNEQ